MKKILFCLFGVALFWSVPYWLYPNHDFVGTDDLGKQEIERSNPAMTPWIEELFQAPSEEGEAILFRIQQLGGLLVVGTILYWGAKEARKKTPE